MDDLMLQSLSGMITCNRDSVMETKVSAKNILTRIGTREKVLETEAKKITRPLASIKHER